MAELVEEKSAGCVRKVRSPTMRVCDNAMANIELQASGKACKSPKQAYEATD
jgi:hypothetical protein